MVESIPWGRASAAQSLCGARDSDDSFGEPMEYPLGADSDSGACKPTACSGIQKPGLRRPCTLRVLKSVRHGTGGGFFCAPVALPRLPSEAHLRPRAKFGGSFFVESQRTRPSREKSEFAATGLMTRNYSACSARTDKAIRMRRRRRRGRGKWGKAVGRCPATASAGGRRPASGGRRFALASSKNPAMVSVCRSWPSPSPAFACTGRMSHQGSTSMFNGPFSSAAPPGWRGRLGALNGPGATGYALKS